MGVLGSLSRRAGKDGRVIGLERDVTHLAAARAYLHDENLTNVELIEGDVHETDLPQETFDLVHERFVLPYVDVDDVVHEMIRLARPGGIICLQEPDHHSWNHYPQSPKWLKLLGVLESAFALRGDINIGRRVFDILKQAGLDDVKIRAATIALQDGHPYMRLPLVAMGALRPVIVQNGLATDAELDDYMADLERQLNNPDTYAVMFTVIQVWGRKPLA
jgi:SAM-dependent methyltransferase